jgi:hypothetical protein
MSVEHVMFLSLVLVALLILGLVAIVVLFRNLDMFKSAKTNSSADKSKEQKK